MPEQAFERPNEIRAREIVCTATGASYDLLDQGGLQGVADYRLRLPSAPAGVLEVTSHGDPQRMNLAAQMDRGGWTHPSARLHHFWSLYLPRIARRQERLPYRFADVIDNLSAIEDLLVTLEGREVLEVRAGEDSSQGRTLRRLGVEWAMGLNSGEPSLNFLPPGASGGSGPAAVAAAVEAEAAKADNLRKLVKGPYPEEHQTTASSFPAHLFVWLSPSAGLPYFALADNRPPSALTSPPAEVTDIWVAGTFRSGEVVWRWTENAWARIVTNRPFHE